MTFLDETSVEPEEQDLEGIKEMLVSILNIHIENDQDYDEDLKSTLQNLLTQITEDQGSLSFDELSQIHVTIKALLEDTDDTALSSELSDQDSDSDRDKRKRRKRAEPKSSKEDLRTSKKKRKQSSDAKHGNSKRRHRSQKNMDEYADSSFEKLQHGEDTNEVEAGEIDDVYDEELAVEKEFEDLLNYNNTTGTANIG